MKKGKLLIVAVLCIGTALCAAACNEGGDPADDPVLETVFTLDKSEVTLTAGGDPAPLSLKVENVDEDLVWESSNEEIVTIAKGTSPNRVTLSALETGYAVVSVSAGDLIAVCKVSVLPTPVITLSDETLDLLAGTTALLRYETNFEGELTFSSEDPEVADVNREGLISAKSEGSTKITISGGGTSAVCTVSVTEPYVILDQSELLLSLSGTAEYQLNATSNGTVRWSTSDPSVATVEEGLVKAIGVGNAVITAKYGSAQATCDVLVKQAMLTLELSETQKQLGMGESFTLSVTITPEQSGDNARVIWSVMSGNDIVSVNDEGVVTSLGKAGDAVVRVTSALDADFYAECTVHVPAPYEDWIAIGDAASLRRAFSSGNETKNMYLTADIDLGGEALVSTLESYSGIFDGCGHSITDFRCGILFGRASGAQGGLQADGIVRRLSLQCTLSDLGGNLGLFGMEMGGTVENCFIDVTFGTTDYQSVFARNALSSSKVTNTIIVIRNPNNTQFVFGGTVQGGGTWQNVYCTDGGSVNVNGPAKKTEAELTGTSFYEGWDPEVWEIAEGELPRLKHTSLA